MSSTYERPFTVTHRVLDLVVRISEEIGRRGLAQDPDDEPAAPLARIRTERDTSAAAKASLKPPKKSGRFAKA